MAGQSLQILQSFAQWGEIDGHNGETEIQVRSKVAMIALGTQVLPLYGCRQVRGPATGSPTSAFVAGSQRMPSDWVSA
jgi:hypothetical protein